jgi:hypothetical protein
MMRNFWAILLAGIGLSLTAAAASANGYAAPFVTRTYTPVYQCPGPWCQTHIRLHRGTKLAAYCWDGWEGWCEIRSKRFTNMFVPRYALDKAHSGGYGGYRSLDGYDQPKVYGYRKAYHEKPAVPYDQGYHQGPYKATVYTHPKLDGYGDGYRGDPYQAKVYHPKPYGDYDGDGYKPRHKPETLYDYEPFTEHDLGTGYDPYD